MLIGKHETVLKGDATVAKSFHILKPRARRGADGVVSIIVFCARNRYSLANVQLQGEQQHPSEWSWDVFGRLLRAGLGAIWRLKSQSRGQNYGLMQGCHAHVLSLCGWLDIM